MIENPSDLPPKKRLGDRPIEQHPSPELQRVLHELLNQLTIMNLCCFKFRAAAANNLDRSVSAEIDRIERTIVDMTSLLAKLPQSVNTISLNSSCAVLSRGKAKARRSQPGNVYPLFKPQGRTARHQKD